MAPEEGTWPGICLSRVSPDNQSHISYWIVQYNVGLYVKKNTMKWYVNDILVMTLKIHLSRYELIIAS